MCHHTQARTPICTPLCFTTLLGFRGSRADSDCYRRFSDFLRQSSLDSDAASYTNLTPICTPILHQSLSDKKGKEGTKGEIRFVLDSISYFCGGVNFYLLWCKMYEKAPKQLCLQPFRGIILEVTPGFEPGDEGFAGVDSISSKCLVLEVFDAVCEKIHQSYTKVLRLA